MPGFFNAVDACLQIPDPAEKVSRTRQLFVEWTAGNIEPDTTTQARPIGVPGRPEYPRLVHPSKVARRKLSSAEGVGAFLHALAHIEFNAINLALDAAYRFRGLPAAYYGDWLEIAAEEALHFEFLVKRLKQLGFSYGDYPAHDGLWEIAVTTAGDVLVRMAIVPRVFEARGLDVTPDMIRRLLQVGDEESAAVLEIIFKDEIGHVSTGTHWFRHICRARGHDPEKKFISLLAEYMPGRNNRKMNVIARKQAGFTDYELTMLGMSPEGESI